MRGCTGNEKEYSEETRDDDVLPPAGRFSKSILRLFCFGAEQLPEGLTMRVRVDINRESERETERGCLLCIVENPLKSIMPKALNIINREENYSIQTIILKNNCNNNSNNVIIWLKLLFVYIQVTYPSTDKMVKIGVLKLLLELQFSSDVSEIFRVSSEPCNVPWNHGFWN